MVDPNSHDAQGGGRGLPTRSDFFTKVLVPVLTVATPVLVAVLTWLVNDAKIEIEAGQQRLREEVARVDQEIQRLEVNRRERESLQGYNITVLKEVKLSLATEDPKLQQVVIALLGSMPNQDLGQAWLKAIEESENTSEDIKTAAKNTRQASEYDQEQKELASILSASTAHLITEAVFNWEDYDYDVFWCESSPDEARQVADTVVKALSSQGAKGRLRVRMLPTKVNERPGYQVEGYEIRRNSDEGEQAEALKKLGDEIIGSQGSFKIRQSIQPTKYYLSAFICTE